MTEVQLRFLKFKIWFLQGSHSLRLIYTLLLILRTHNMFIMNNCILHSFTYAISVQNKSTDHLLDSTMECIFLKIPSMGTLSSLMVALIQHSNLNGEPKNTNQRKKNVPTYNLFMFMKLNWVRRKKKCESHTQYVAGIMLTCWIFIVYII